MEQAAAESVSNGAGHGAGRPWLAARAGGGLSSRIPSRVGWLLVPAVLLFLAFMVLPLLMLGVLAFNPSVRGVLALSGEFTLDNFSKFFASALYHKSLITSLKLGLLTVIATIVLGYPLAFIMARTPDKRIFTLLSVLVLASMQLDMTIRLYGMITLFGNTNGLLNQLLTAIGLPALQLVYNSTGVVLGMVQFTLPFMVLSLIGLLINLNPTYEHAARSLGAGRWRAFWTVTFPLSLPAVIAGSVIVFSLSISSYIVPVLLGSSRVPTLATHLYQQISEMGIWQFGSAIATILFLASLLAIGLSFRVARRYAGARG